MISYDVCLSPTSLSMHSCCCDGHYFILFFMATIPLYIYTWCVYIPHGVCVCMYVCVCVSLFICICIYVCVGVGVGVYMYIHIYISHIFLIHSFVDGHLGCFHVRIVVHVPFPPSHTHVPFPCLAHSGALYTHL